jgi:hypothetical protein
MANVQFKYLADTNAAKQTKNDGSKMHANPYDANNSRVLPFILYIISSPKLT